MGQYRSTYPSRPVAGYRHDAEQAERDPPNLADLAVLLDRYRAGCPAAHVALLHRLRYLLYRAAGDWHVTRHTALGACWRTYSDCIRRLRTNLVAPNRVAAYVATELYYTVKRQYSEDGPLRITVPRSTNSTRKKKGQTMYTDLIQTSAQSSRRRHAPTDSDQLIERSDVRAPVADQSGCLYVLPSRLRQQTVIDLTDCDPEARQVASLHLEGHSKVKIGQMLDLSRRQVDAAFSRLRAVI